MHHDDRKRLSPGLRDRPEKEIRDQTSRSSPRARYARGGAPRRPRNNHGRILLFRSSPPARSMVGYCYPILLFSVHHPVGCFYFSDHHPRGVLTERVFPVSTVCVIVQPLQLHIHPYLRRTSARTRGDLTPPSRRRGH